MQLIERTPIQKTRILAVDDNLVSLRLLEIMLDRDDFEVITARGGVEAYAILERADKDGCAVDIILLDRMMPEMDGIEFCQKINQDSRFRSIPVIMQTAAGNARQVKEGLDAGVFYYLVKPLIAPMLLSVIDAARRRIRRYRFRHELASRYKAGMKMVCSLVCEFRTPGEGEDLAAYLAQFLPAPDLVVTGLGELFLNAVEHGNLGIDYELKGQLLKENCWQEEIENRLCDPLYREKKVTVILTRKAGEFQVGIRDEGHGFEWQKYLEVDENRALDNHGRGIAMANMLSFDQLVYNEKGNSVTAIINADRS